MLIILAIVMAGVTALAFETLQSRLFVRFPDTRRQLAQIGFAGKAGFLAAAGVGAVWLIGHTDYAAISLPLPDHQQPPPLASMKWTAYDTDEEEHAEQSMALPVTQLDDGRIEVWNRYDDRQTRETTLTLTRFDCAQESLTESLAIYFRGGNYEGYDELDEQEIIPVDRRSPDGAGLLLACFGIRPSSI